MGIKNKKNCKLWRFTERYNFGHWFIKKNDKQGGFSEKGELGQLADLRGGLIKTG